MSMKILVLGLDLEDPGRLLADDRLGHVRRLMDAGLYGRLEEVNDPTGHPLPIPGPTFWDHLAGSGKRTLQVVEQSWRDVRHLLQRETWDAFQFVVASRESSAEDEPLDVEIGRVLELLDGETVLLVVALRGGRDGDRRGAFVLASSNCPPAGEVEGVRSIDLAATLLELAGAGVPDSIPGASILAGLADRLGSGQGGHAEDEEALVRARLSGLGYLA